MVKCKNCKHLQLLGDRNYWCEQINDSPDIVAERECDCFKRATNHDVVKRMATKELAELLTNPTCHFCPYIQNCLSTQCVDGVTQWLQEEVDE